MTTPRPPWAAAIRLLHQAAIPPDTTRVQLRDFLADHGLRLRNTALNEVVWVHRRMSQGEPQ